MTFEYLTNGYQKYTDPSDFYARFIEEEQLLDPALWRTFVEVFRTREDAADDGWRGEYFGKMMRGACLTYRYLGDERLYSMLEEAVRDLLSAADEKGRIASYPTDHELCGWDLWCRKYVLVGCLHFYAICRDDAFKTEILDAMKAHLDAIVEKVGDGKTPITETSVWYGGMNSSSLLEPVVEMVKLTKDPRYLAFAEYIIGAGGCKQGNVLEATAKGTLPHELPTTKAYETMSFFEGILAYYELTEKSEYLSLVQKFSDLVEENEITAIGSAGCRNEHFDHALLTQTKKYPDKYIMQETCVTVTWMRLQERLLRVTGQARYADRIERAALNALYGAVNIHKIKQYSKEEKRLLDALPFDSYSPLVSARRGVGIGGFKRLSNGGYYGCCACIGAAGTALYPLSSVLKAEGGAVVSFYHSGAFSFETDKGERVTFECEGDVADGEIMLTFRSEKPLSFPLCLRIPDWSESPVLNVAGEESFPEAGYISIDRLWRNGDEIRLSLHPLLTMQEIEGKVAFSYGPFTLARDQGKDPFFAPHRIGDLDPTYRKLPPEEGERVRLSVRSGKKEFLLTDYASCGKHWDRRRSKVTVWQTVE